MSLKTWLTDKRLFEMILIPIIFILSFKMVVLLKQKSLTMDYLITWTDFLPWVYKIPDYGISDAGVEFSKTNVHIKRNVFVKANLNPVIKHVGCL